MCSGRGCGGTRQLGNINVLMCSSWRFVLQACKRQIESWLRLLMALLCTDTAPTVVSR